MSNVTLDRARAAKSAAFDHFSTLAEVVGVGITRVHGDYGVKVNVSHPPEPGIEWPTHVNGVPIRVEVTGSLRPRPVG